MNRRVAWATGTLLLVVAAGAAVRLWPGRTPATPSAAVTQPAPAIEIPAEEIVVARVVELTRELRFTGAVRAAQSAFVKARVAGEIVRLAVREGEAVSTGQVLVQQDTTELDWRLRQAEQQAAAARAQRDIAQRTLANNQALVAQGFISPTALESSVSNEAGAQATLQAALAAVELARKARADATLTSPITGVVAQRLAQPGERVGIDARLLEIVDTRSLEVEAQLAPHEVTGLRIDQKARVEVDGLDEPIPARVARISPTAQAGSRTVAVFLRVEPHPALRHGLFARGSIEVDRRNALSLPLSAVRQSGPQATVLRLDGDLVRSQAVQPGERGSGPDGVQRLAIVQGLDEGTRVLGASLGALADGTRWRPAPPAAARPASPPPAGPPASTPAAAAR